MLPFQIGRILQECFFSTRASMCQMRAGYARDGVSLILAHFRGRRSPIAYNKCDYAPSATFELPCKFRKRSDVEIGYESHCHFYEFGRSGFDRYPADRSRLVWCKEITRAGAGNGASCEGVSKGKG